MSDRWPKVEEGVAIWMLYPAVKTYPVRTYGHNEVYRHRRAGELHDVGTQTYEYEHGKLKLWGPYGNNLEYKLTFHCPLWEDMPQPTPDEIPAILAFQNANDCRNVRMQTESSYLLKKDTDCLAVEYVEEEADIDKDNKVLSEVFEDNGKAPDFPPSIEGDEVVKRQYAVPTGGRGRVLPFTFSFMAPPPAAKKGTNIRFGNHSLQAAVPQPKIYYDPTFENWSKVNSELFERGVVVAVPGAINPFNPYFRRRKQ